MKRIVVFALVVPVMAAIEQALTFGIKLCKQTVGSLDHSWQTILGFQMIGTVHKEQRIGGGFGQDVGGEQFNAGNKFGWL